MPTLNAILHLMEIAAVAFMFGWSMGILVDRAYMAYYKWSTRRNPEGNVTNIDTP